jgi:hypothetical protein
MHYRAIAFSKDHLRATIVPKDRKAFFSIGQRVRFSPMDLAKLNVLYNCSTDYYYRGGDVPSPVPEAGKDIAFEQDRLSETAMKKGTLSAKSENALFSESGIKNNTFPQEAGKDISSGDFIAKPEPENETFSSESEEKFSSEDLFSKPVLQKGNFSLEYEDKISHADLFSKLKIKREIFIQNFGNYLSSAKDLFSTSRRGHFFR